MSNIAEFLKNCPPTGGNKKYVITCNGVPFAGFDSKSEAKAALEMYSTEIKLKKGGLAFCSQQKWDLQKNG